MNCIQCHDPHGMDIMKPAGGLALSRGNETCAQCHREEARPMVFEHPALRENPHLTLVATEYGGHLGFLQRSGRRFWIDEVVTEWIAGRLKPVGAQVS